MSNKFLRCGLCSERYYRNELKTYKSNNNMAILCFDCCSFMFNLQGSGRCVTPLCDLLSDKVSDVKQAVSTVQRLIEED